MQPLSTCKMGAELAETFQVLPRPQAPVLGESGTHNTPRSSPSKRTWCPEVLLSRVVPGATFRSPLVLAQRSCFTNNGSERVQTSSSFSPVQDTSEMPLLACVESFSELQCIRSSFPSTLPSLPRCQTWNALGGWFPMLHPLFYPLWVLPRKVLAHLIWSLGLPLDDPNYNTHSEGDMISFHFQTSLWNVYYYPCLTNIETRAQRD